MQRHLSIAFALAVAACGSDPEDGEEGGEGSSSSSETSDPSNPTAGPTSSPATSAEASSSSVGDESTGDTGETTSSPTTTGIELDCEGSVLADLVEGMPARSWVTMPDNASLDALDMTSSLLYWNDSAVWNPNQRRLQWVGGPGTCCADPAQYRLMAYEELTDTWTIEDTPFIGSGHAYDGNAMDPSTGLHYFALFSNDEVNTYDGASWGTLPAIPFDAPAAMGIAWFEEMGGLVYAGGFGNVAWFDGASWTELSGAEDAPWGSYNMYAEYSPVHEVVWVGAGNGADTINYVVDASGNLTRGADAPISLNNGASVKSVDPISGNYLVGDTEVGEWWEYDPSADAWEEVTEMADEPDMGGRSVFHVPLAHCGVTLFFGHYWEERDVWLYRHSPV